MKDRATKTPAQIERNQKTMRAMRNTFPHGTCGICRKANQRIVGRTVPASLPVCSDCYGSLRT